MVAMRMNIPHFRAPNSIFEVGLSGNEILVYSYLLRCSNQGSNAIPRNKTIAEKCGMGERSVKYATSSLQEKGLLFKKSRAGKNGNKSNLYLVKRDPGDLIYNEDKKEYFRVPNKIFEIALNKHEILVYIYLVRCDNQKNTAFPKNKTIAKKCGIKKRTVQYTTKSLKDRGIIAKQERKIARDWNRSNVYILEYDLDNLDEKIGAGVQNMHLSHAGYAPNIKNYKYKESVMKKRSELNSTNNANYYSNNKKTSHEKKDNNKSHAEIGNLKLDYEVDEEVDEDIPF